MINRIYWLFVFFIAAIWAGGLAAVAIATIPILAEAKRGGHITAEAFSGLVGDSLAQWDSLCWAPLALLIIITIIRAVLAVMDKRTLHIIVPVFMCLALTFTHSMAVRATNETRDIAVAHFELNQPFGEKFNAAHKASEDWHKYTMYILLGTLICAAVALVFFNQSTKTIPKQENDDSFSHAHEETSS